jgi:hypothetical protein
MAIFVNVEPFLYRPCISANVALANPKDSELRRVIFPRTAPHRIHFATSETPLSRYVGLLVSVYLDHGMSLLLDWEVSVNAIDVRVYTWE